MEKLIFVLFGVCLGMAILGIVFSWTPPGQAPPGGNVAQPINVSTSTQYKAGALGIGGVFQAYGGSANPVLNVVGSNVGIGTMAPSYKLHVHGGDIYSSGYVRGASGLCIGSDCRNSWSSGGGKFLKNLVYVFQESLKEKK